MSRRAGQFFLNTAESARNYFWTERTSWATVARARDAPILPAGTYRVIDGELTLILPGVPPALELTPTKKPPPHP